MKKTLVIVALLLVPTAVAAAVANDMISLPSGVTVADNYIRFGSTVNIDGNVSGDLIVGGQDVIVTGAVGGDVLGVANSLTISGPVSGNIRVAANKVMLENTVGKNVTMAGNMITITNESTIDGTTALAGSSIIYSGRTKRHLDAVANSFSGRGIVEGDMRVQGSKDKNAVSVTLGDGASVGGNFTYTSGHTADVASGVKIGGTTNFKQAKEHKSVSNRLASFQSVVKLFGTILLGLVLLGLFRKFVYDVTEAMQAKPGRSVAVGVMVMFIVPLVSIVLLVTLIGAPLAVLLVAAYASMYVVSTVLIGLRVGQWLAPWLAKHGVKFAGRLSPTWMFIFGTLVTILVLDALLGFSWAQTWIISTLQFILRAFLVLWSTGALVHTVWTRLKIGAN